VVERNLPRVGSCASFGSSISSVGVPILDPESRAVVGLRGEENAGQPVVFLLRDGVELVIVAARACHRHAEKGLGSGVELLIGQVQRVLAAVLLGETLGADGQKAGRDGMLGLLDCIMGRQQVAGELLAHEFIVRLVAVERLDDVGRG